jgi:hypothetical protein
MTHALLQMLVVLGITFAVAMLVAAGIKLLVRLTARLELAAGGPEAAKVCPIDEGIPEDDVAALTAALYAIIGPHRIVHIGGAGHGRSWAAEGRAAHHTSHAVPHGTKQH